MNPSPPRAHPVWLLSQFNIFTEIPWADAALASAGTLDEQRYERGEEIVGADGWVCLVRSGRVRVDRARRAGSVTRTALGPGQAFGYGDLLGAGDPGTAVAATHATILQATLPDLLNALGSTVQAMGVISLIDHVCRLEHHLEQVHRRRVPARIAGVLVELGDRSQRTCGVPLIDLAHTDVARRAGTTRESVSRVVASLKRQGAISGHAALRVIDAERLRTLAGEEMLPAHRAPGPSTLGSEA